MMRRRETAFAGTAVSRGSRRGFARLFVVLALAACALALTAGTASAEIATATAPTITEVTGDSAHLSSTLDPKGGRNYPYFEYSTDQVNWTVGPEGVYTRIVEGEAGPSKVEETLVNLKADTKYYVRARLPGRTRIHRALFAGARPELHDAAHQSAESRSDQRRLGSRVLLGEIHRRSRTARRRRIGRRRRLPPRVRHRRRIQPAQRGPEALHLRARRDLHADLRRPKNQNDPLQRGAQRRAGKARSAEQHRRRRGQRLGRRRRPAGTSIRT